MNNEQFKTKLLKIKKQYSQRQEQEKQEIQNMNMTKEEKNKMYAGLGKYKKMAKNEMIGIFIEEHIEELIRMEMSQNMLLDVFKTTLKRQPNQDQRYFNLFNGKVSKSDYSKIKNSAIERIEKIDKFPILKKELKY